MKNLIFHLVAAAFPHSSMGGKAATNTLASYDKNKHDKREMWHVIPSMLSQI